MPLTSSSMWWKMVSARPMTTRPAVSDTIPIHMYGRIVRPRNATDSRPVNTHTEPNEHTTWNKVNILTYKVNILKRVLLHIEPVFCQILHNIVLRFWYPYQVFRTLRLHNCYLDTLPYKTAVFPGVIYCWPCILKKLFAWIYHKFITTMKTVWDPCFK